MRSSLKGWASYRTIKVSPLRRLGSSSVGELLNNWFERIRDLFTSRSHSQARPQLYIQRTAFDSTDNIPHQIGNWRVLDVIGSGTSSTVYRVVPAWSTGSKQHYALKLHSDRQSSERDSRERFKREIKLLKSVKHRNVVEMIETGEYHGRQFLVMEIVDGHNLRESYKKQRPQLPGLLDWSIQIARGLSATHQRGIIHRDLKPENILSTRIGVIKLADFGLARDGSHRAITRPGLLVGTPAYMAPETLLGREPDHRSDLYSLGVILYELFTGCMPYQAETVAEFIDAHLEAKPIPARQRNPNLPPELERIILRLLCKNPRDRFQSATDLVKALENVLAEVVGVRKSWEGGRIVA